ncbi:MAG: CRTAC1 family protein [Gemmatimonadetes bacterium]|jgi:enediyne biosynthesis protein E4|nr:CRTAC1 family protein [Gemmatimonadota bacterium]
MDLPNPSLAVVAALLVFFSGVSGAGGEVAEKRVPRFRFVDVAHDAGLTRVVHAGRPGKDHLLDSAGTGVAWLDFDKDGHLDAYIVNSWKMAEDRIVERGKNALYRNLGDGSFEDVTERSGTGGDGHWGCGVAVADYDADGWPDILVTNFGPNLLYRNRGDGSFENVAAQAGIEVPEWSTGAAFFDADGDGDLDLYIAGYIEATREEVLKARPTLDWKGVDKVAFGPFGLKGALDHFFLFDGTGSYAEFTAEAGLADRSRGFGFGVRTADLDADGDLDLYIANDSDANYFYRNEGGGTFQEVGLWTGAAFDVNGAAQAGMGVAVGDVDGDLNLDIVVTNFAEDFSTLYRSLGSGFFEDASAEAGVGGPSFPLLSWGASLADLDNDGDLDLTIANGHIYPQVDDHPQLSFSYRQPNLLLENIGSGRFIDVTDEAGPGFQLIEASRGLAAGDYDNDGDLDLLFSNLDEPPTLLRNESEKGSWLSLVLEIPPGRGPVIGTRVVVTAGGKRLIRDVASGGSYLSTHDHRLHFGLGSVGVVERIEITWPDGHRTVREEVAANQFLAISREP